MTLTSTSAPLLVQAVLAAASARGVAVVVAVVDASGHLRAMVQADSALVTSVSIAQVK